MGEEQMSRRSGWLELAACGGRLDLDWIEPTLAEARLCRAICAGCPVRSQCAEEAILSGEPWGIWGGLDPDQRAALAALIGISGPRMLPAHGTNSRYAKHGCRCLICRAAHTEYEYRRRRRLPAPATAREQAAA